MPADGSQVLFTSPSDILVKNRSTGVQTRVTPLLSSLLNKGSVRLVSSGRVTTQVLGGASPLGGAELRADRKRAP